MDGLLLVVGSVLRFLRFLSGDPEYGHVNKHRTTCLLAPWCAHLYTILKILIIVEWCWPKHCLRPTSSLNGLAVYTLWMFWTMYSE